MGKVDVLIAAGGSGGHFYPALSVARKIKALNKATRVSIVTGDKQLDREMLAESGFDGIHTGAMGLNGVAVWTIPWRLLRNLLSFVRCYFLMWHWRPKVVFGTGGYVGGVVMAAAFLTLRRTVVHESNITPGRANRLLAWLAGTVLVASQESAEAFGNGKKVKVVGTPVRDEIMAAKRPAAVKRLKLDPDKFTLLALGGSQGAHNVNEAMLGFLETIARRDVSLQVLLMTGWDDYQWVVDSCQKSELRMVIRPFIHNMPDAYAVADLVISRAGAITMAEITARGLPAILVPLPGAGGHQGINAEWMAQQGAAVVLPERELSGASLSEMVVGMIRDKRGLAKMSRESRRLGGGGSASRLLAEEIVGLLGGKH
jgi:UDP-N-acetylglucosamine--N-acetylmuramyl-(pentapeptide) pyrophosphoryl-undecaprenol N-acetylglucosamine transferase